MLAPFFVLAAPYILFLSVHAGHFAVEGKFNTNFAYQTSILKGVSTEEFLFKIDNNTLEVPKAPPQGAKNDLAFKARILLLLKKGGGCIKELVNRLEDSLCLGEPLLLGFIVLGLFGSKWPQGRLADETLLLLVIGVSGAAYFIGMPLFMSRHLATFFCIMLIWAAKGAYELSVWAVESFGLTPGSVAANRTFNPVVCAIPVALWLTISLVGTVRLNSYDLKGDVIDKQVGRWIKSEMSSEGTMMDTMPIAAFYSGLNMIPFPYCDSATALKYIQKNGINVIVLRTTDSSRPYLKSWMESGIPDDRAKLVNTLSGRDGCIVKIYRWQPDPGHTS